MGEGTRPSDVWYGEGLTHSAALEHRLREIRLLGESPGVEGTEKLVEMLEDGSWSIRNAAAMALGARGAVEAVPRLLAVLQRGDGDSLGVLRGLDLLGRREYWPPGYWREHVMRRDGDLLAEPEPNKGASQYIVGLTSARWQDRLQAAYALGRLGDQGACRPLTAALDDDDSSVRSRAAESLGLLGCIEAVPRLADRLMDDEAPVRENVAMALGCLGDPSVATALMRALDAEPGYSVACAMVEALGRLGDPDALDPIIRFQRRVGDRVPIPPVEDALAALAPGIVDRLVALLEGDEDPIVRAVCASALREVRDPRVVAALESALGDENYWVSEYARESLGR